MRISRDDNYLKYYLNILQSKITKKIIISKWLGTLMKTFRRLDKKEKRFIVVTYKMEQHDNAQQE